MHWSYGGWWSWFVMASSMVVFWALVFWLITSFVRTPGRSSRTESASPAEVLAGRFAAGEIDEREYRTRLEALRSTADGKGVTID